jgi:hypothetical protein
MIVKAQQGSNGVNLTFANTEMVTAPPMISKTWAKTAHAALAYADVLAHGYCSFWFQNRPGTITEVVSAIVDVRYWFSRAGGLVGSLAMRPPMSLTRSGYGAGRRQNPEDHAASSSGSPLCAGRANRA